MLTLLHQFTHAIAVSVVGVLLIAGPRLVLAEESRIVSGDPRDGYEHADYQTHSVRLYALEGRALDLASLLAQPPLGLPALPITPDISAVQLGKRLFFDRRLSANRTLSCGMCHIPEQGFAQNELATPVGMQGRSVRRNAPALYNVAYRRALFLDGSKATLEEQAWKPLLAANEMANPSREQVLTRLATIDDYAAVFARVFGPSGINATNLAAALASYQRSLLSADSAFDRWHFAGDESAMSDEAARGFALFSSLGCSDCHRIDESNALFTSPEYHNTGVEYASLHRPVPTQVQIAPGVFVKLAEPPLVNRMDDKGRAEVTGEPEDTRRYAVPSLRNVALTAPYMHDGSLATLDDVIDYYNGGGSADPNKDARLRRLDLDEEQSANLKAFLHALTGSNVAALAADARATPIGDTRH